MPLPLQPAAPAPQASGAFPTSLRALNPWQLLLGAALVLLAREAASVAHAHYFGRAAPLSLAHCPSAPADSAGDGAAGAPAGAPVGAPAGGGSAAAPPAVSTAKFKFPPSIRRIIVNVGSNVAPPMPKEDDIAVIAVEPMLPTAWAIPKHERVYVVTAAIAGTVGFANFFSYNFNGESSSLTEMVEEDKAKSSGWWAADTLREKGYPPVNFVPVLTMRMLLEAIPEELEVILLKTDMQGYDFTAVSTAGDALLRVKQLYSEVNCHGFAYNPSAPGNDFDVVWANYMAGMHYSLSPTVHCPANPCESNALWTRPGDVVPDGVWWE